MDNRRYSLNDAKTGVGGTELTSSDKPKAQTQTSTIGSLASAAWSLISSQFTGNAAPEEKGLSKIQEHESDSSSGSSSSSSDCDYNAKKKKSRRFTTKTKRLPANFAERVLELEMLLERDCSSMENIN